MQPDRIIIPGMISLWDSRKEAGLMKFAPKEIILKDGQKCTIRRFEKKDAKAVSALIAYTLRTTNRADYSEEYLEKDIQCLQPENLISRAEVQHFYVAEDDNRIVGCGSIGSYWGKEDESSLFTIFVHPDQQGKGLGQSIIETLEQDEYALRAKRIEIPASITGLPFYLKMGYSYKNGKAVIDEEQLYRLEKFREPVSAQQTVEQEKQQRIAAEMLNIICGRHSYRGKYKPDTVPRDKLKMIMEAGLAAPSGCNKQTTSLIAVDDPALLKKVLAVIDPPVAVTAPAVICVLTQRINAYRDRCFAVQDYSAAIENMLLMIRALGYASCWYEGHITDSDRIGDQIAAVLRVPDGYELVCLLPVGVPEDEPRAPKKKSFQERAWFNEIKLISNVHAEESP